MIPVKTDLKDYDYPDFQPDQILTAEDLNHMFHFLDQQERLTRTNLIGIGILCGLQVSKAADGKTVTITKGTGVTSHGYLIVQGIENSEAAINYKKYRTFDALKEQRYPVFVDGNTQRYALWELIAQEDEEATDLELSPSFLNNKVCLLFYEILEEKAKNCDPTSCDDKGVKVYVNIRKLLISVANATAIINELNQKANASGSGEVFPAIYTLSDLRLPRFDVQATTLETASQLYEAYQKVFSKEFVDGVGVALGKAYDSFKPYLENQPNPFSDFNTKFAFLHNGTIVGNSLLHFQYYHGFFCDLLLAYQEWRTAAHELMGMCTPPEALFPRHLFLGELTGGGGVAKSKFRNFFIPSPLHASHKKYNTFQALFKRLERLITNFRIPAPAAAVTRLIDANIRVTPSVLGKHVLGERAIPYYYSANEASKRLLDVWNPKLTQKGKEKQNLHYNPTYNTTDDFVKNPLFYDLEPYNFFRVEGHIGKSFTSVLATLQDTRTKHRLPFDVVAVTVDSIPNTIDPTKFPCHFQDLQALYETLRAELLCKLCKALSCIYRLDKRTANMAEGSSVERDELQKSAVNLIQGCSDVLYYRESSVGYVYEKLQPNLVEKKVTGIELMESMKRANLLKLMEIRDVTSVAPTNQETDAVIYFVQLIQLLVSLSQTLPETLSTYTYTAMQEVLQELGKILQPTNRATNSLVQDRFAASECLKELLNLCELAPFRALYAEYLERVEKLKKMQTLREFSNAHPGLQHKGGVPVGGTFVIVYRDLVPDNPDAPGIPPVRGVTDLTDFILDEIVVTADRVTATTNRTTKKEVYTAKQRTEFTKKINMLQSKGLLRQEIEEMLGIKIADVLRGQGRFDNQLRNIGNGIVIADFYLPYLCCSDCPPMQFIINIPPPKLSFGLDTEEYCQADEEEYTFQTSPTGGKITTDQGDAVADKGEGVFAFVPAKVIIPDEQRKVTVSFTYTLEDQSQTISVIVYRMPAVKILAKERPENPLTYEFVLDRPDMVTAAEWDFGDESTSSAIKPPPHTYRLGGTYTVGVTVRNGVCTAKVEDVTVEVNNPEPAEVDLPQSEICETANSLRFTIKPAGGTLVGVAVSETEAGSGNYEFLPSAANLNGEPQRTITFNYTSLQGQTATFSITVHASPSGSSVFEPTGALRLRVFFRGLRHATTAIVDFGDGTKEEYPVAGQAQFTTPEHQYAQGGDYTLRTYLVNGTCTTELPELHATVREERPQEEEKVCQTFDVPVHDFIRLQEPLQGSDEFMRSYRDVLQDVQLFFEMMFGELSSRGTVPLEFFETAHMQPSWIRLLPNSPAVARTLSLQLLIIYIRVLINIACMRKEDVDELLTRLLKMSIEKLQELHISNARERDLLQKLLQDMEAELDNRNNSGEAAIKVQYIELLQELIRVIREIIGS
ncbi:hypothetical protein FVR03_05215 [Pontibacter qinzhouensis]|uniref:PKD domain-containing protein n=1 Tax=Pontibacter qinzhouensis TaxID=2603253 RepID=A0A5C8KE63_9BACT|nr:PKD domain-containing protein [Pontibacter qinzhouensis]TXK50291.1 hypothetical protein FVR03_05215 [Pontibacter qinzhouensis]